MLGIFDGSLLWEYESRLDLCLVFPSSRQTGESRGLGTGLPSETSEGPGNSSGGEGRIFALVFHLSLELGRSSIKIRFRKDTALLCLGIRALSAPWTLVASVWLQTFLNFFVGGLKAVCKQRVLCNLILFSESRLVLPILSTAVESCATVPLENCQYVLRDDRCFGFLSFPTFRLR